MPETMLAAELGREIGSSATRRLRRDGRIPGVVYGHGIDPISVSVDAKDFRTAMSGEQGLNTLLSLEAGSENFLVLAREIQRHPVRGTVSHVDFQVIDPNEGVDVEVPLQVIGDATDVRHHDWEVDQQLYSLHVRARPNAIPNVLIVDISELKHGSAIRIADVELPDGVEASQDPSAIVVGTHAGRTARQAGTPVEDEAATDDAS